MAFNNSTKNGLKKRLILAQTSKSVGKDDLKFWVSDKTCTTIIIIFAMHAKYRIVLYLDLQNNKTFQNHDQNSNIYFHQNVELLWGSCQKELAD